MGHQHAKNKRRKHSHRPEWVNSTKTERVSPMRYYHPTSLEELKEDVQEAIDTKIPIRAVGSGHSFSEAPLTYGILLDTDALDKVVTKSYQGDKCLVEVEGGIKLRKLNSWLDQNGLCISTMGGIDHQSIAGALSTGTHGSSMDFGTMVEMVKSIKLVTQKLDDPKKVGVYRIERKSDQITPSDPNVDRLILDDNTFNSAVVCFGTMGIIYSYVLRVEEMYYLSEKKSIVDWPSLKGNLKNGLLKKHRSVFVQIAPYRFKKIPNKRDALLATHDLASSNTNHNLSLQSAKRGIWHKFKRSTRSFGYEFTAIFPYTIYFFERFLNWSPNYIPRFLRTATRAQKDEEFFHKGHKVMYQGLDKVKERAYDCEIGIKMDKEGKYLDLVDELIDYLEELRKAYGLHITSPLGLRFTKSSEVFMAPENGTDICYIDTPVLLKVHGRETILTRIQQFLLNHDARPHWGKLNFLMDSTYVFKEYPKANDFLTEVKKFNPDQIFSNRFSKRVLGW